MAKEKSFLVAVQSRMRRWQAAAFLGVAATITGCASYTAKPIVPSNTAAALERRTLDEPALAQFIEVALPERANAGGSPNWDLSTLTLAALYFHPEMEVSRAKLALARAGVKTAGQFPNPTLSFSPGQYPALIEASAWTVGFLINFVLETAGKREKRIEQARNLVEAARQDIATAAWQVRGGVRSALLDLWAAEARLRLVERRQAVQAQVVTLLESRFVAGETSALDVARERINLCQARLSLRDTERQAAEARARLAAALGVPVRAIEPVKLSLGSFDRPAETPDLNDLAAGPIRRKALQERTDVLGLLAEYEAMQSALRLQIAKQFPDITLGPGYTYDQGFDLYTFDLSVELPIFNQNQGPIAEAEARRKEAAARFVALQAKIIGDIDRAIASYRGATRAVATADALVQSQMRRRQQINRAFRLGEVDRLAVLTTDLEQAVIDLARFEAVVQQREALALIEDALQQSMFDGGSLYIRLPEKMPDKEQTSARR
jgi:outer membrane protein TolC